MVLADYILGGGALKSRLADRIRQKEGLSYGVGSQFYAPAQEPAALWQVYAISAPQNTRKVEAAMREELQRALTDGFTEDELSEAKKAWKQGEEVARTQDASLARRLSAYLNIDRTMAFDQSLEAKVAGLTLAQVNQALRQTLKPGNLSVVIAGDFAKVAASTKP
jgi:zinc protease